MSTFACGDQLEWSNAGPQKTCLRLHLNLSLVAKECNTVRGTKILMRGRCSFMIPWELKLLWLSTFLCSPPLHSTSTRLRLSLMRSEGEREWRTRASRCEVMQPHRQTLPKLTRINMAATFSWQKQAALDGRPKASCSRCSCWLWNTRWLPVSDYGSTSLFHPTTHRHDSFL